MEGPSLVIAKEQLQPFCGLPVLKVTGNTKIGKERLEHQQVKDIFSWGKHLVFQFDTFAIRVHFLLFGTYQAQVNGVSVSGDYERKSKEPRLALEFANGGIQMYNCSIKFIETGDAISTYDTSVDIMANEWEPKKALDTVKAQPTEMIADILLDQEIFAGVGNIIKNEVLFLTKVHPETQVQFLSLKKLKEVIEKTRSYSLQFYEWKKEYVLRKHFQIYRKKECPETGDKTLRIKTGKRQRWSFICPTCQIQLTQKLKSLTKS